ncbi:MAG TPA: HAD-IA family hydrolase [Thermomicrobiales bacterium]
MTDNTPAAGRIQAVTFDLYDTLIELHPRRWERLSAALDRLGIPNDVKVLRDADLVAEDFYTQENGRVPIRDRPRAERETFRLHYMSVWLEAAGIPHDPPLLHAVREAYMAEFETPAVESNATGGYRVFSDVLPALRRLREAGIKRAVISNADADVTNLCTHLAFAHEMNAIITSAVVGWEKPDPRTFRAALDALGIEPGAAIHIGDQPKSDVVGALGVGMRAALLDRYGRHDPSQHQVPVYRSLTEFVDAVLAEQGEAVQRQEPEKVSRS